MSPIVTVLIIFGLAALVILLDPVLTKALNAGQVTASMIARRVSNPSREHGETTAKHRAFIFGAGQQGKLALQEFQSANPTLNIAPVGFIDDEILKWGQTINGVPVLGGRKQLKELLKAYDISRLVIAISNPRNSVKRFDEIEAICKDAGVSIKFFKVEIEDLESSM